jgi:hypothetical protein
MPWTELKFGKHKGKTLPQVIFSDPDWFFWAYENKIFRDGQAAEAERIYQRVTSIRVPQAGDGETYVAEYVIDGVSGTFSHLEIVPSSRPRHVGTSKTHRAPVIDLSLISRICIADKSGYKQMINDIKAYVLEDSERRMTKKRCEEFFDDKKNFVVR